MLPLLMALGSCNGDTIPPQSAPPPVAARPAPRPPLPPPPVSLAEAALTPGDWRYSTDRELTQASFGPASGPPEFSFTCELASRTITLSRHGETAGPAYIRILADNQSRLLDARSDPSGTIASLPATDLLLDAIAFTKGSFAEETTGLATLHLPAWAEVSRVIEDCRGPALQPGPPSPPF